VKQRSFLLPILGSLLLAASLRAQQQFPTLERGLQPEKLYHFAGIDNVNVFNGNLTIVLPIGQSYPVDGGLNYQLTLSYNSNLWDWESHADVNPAVQTKSAIPARRSNAGVGWILGAGDFVPKSDPDNNSFTDVYAAPDGGDHRFDKSTDAEVKYTTDGSNLRLRTSLATPTVAFIDFPDGTIQRFEKNATDNHWQLREIAAPRGGAKVTFSTLTSQPAQCSAGTTSWWSVADGTRTHYICFKNQNVDFVNKPMVDTVVLDGPQNQAAVYQFTYITFDVNLPRGEPFPEPFGIGRTSHRVTVLNSITLPDQSSYNFEHDPNQYFSSTGIYNDPNLLSITLPTGGRIEYTYGEQYDVPPMELCLEGVPTTVSGATYFGTPPTVVINRTVRAAAVAGAIGEVGTWSYGWVRNTAQAGALCMSVAGPTLVNDSIPDELIARVTDPDGNRVDTHFSVWPGDMMADSVNGFKPLYYGFPYGKYDAAQDRYLSTEQFKCAGALCNPLRTTYVRHDIELRPIPFPSFPFVAMPIHRLASQRVFYRDDPLNCDPLAATPCRSVTTDSTLYDGFAHYRQIVTSHDFDAGATRTEKTDWNEVGGVPRSITVLDPWTLDEFENRSVQEGTGTPAVLDQACFDTVPGGTTQRFLRATRRLKGSTPVPADVITLLTLGTDGNLGSEKYFGGEAAPLTGGASTASSLCSALSSLAPPGNTAAYEITHTWQNGVMASSLWTGASFLSSDLTIDRSGLVTESRDTAGVLTRYFYDASGRIRRIEPSGVAAIIYSYSNAVIGGVGSLVQPAEAIASRESSSDPMESDFFFDSFGRVWREKVQMPHGKLRVRESLFDSLGRQRTVSEWTDLPSATDPLTLLPPYHTGFFGYDLFGRVGSVQSPDGSIVSFTYVGDRIKIKTVSIATSPAGPSSVPTTETYDGFGRLVSVAEPSGTISSANPGGAMITTQYTYDQSGHLATVKTTDESGTHQDRAFQYDGRGFLVKETHPESGDTNYDQYDARGHVITRLNGGTTLTFAYDFAERLHTVKDQTGKTIKQYDYGIANNGSDLRNGKVISAARRNDLPSAGRIDVTESYEYGETAGMMSKRTTSVDRVGADGVTRTPIQQFAYGLSAYDNLRLPTTVTMPTCSIGDCSSQTTQAGLPSVTSTRTAGFLTDVSGFASLTYQPSGMVENVVHATPQLATDKYSSRFDQPRPSKITFAGCGNTAPFFLPGRTVVKPIATGNSCGLQITWPPAVLCGGSNDIRYRILRDGVDITGPNCLTDPKFVDVNGVILGTTYSYTVIAEGPAVPGLTNPGRCQGGQTTALQPVSGTIASCDATTILTVSPVTASIGVPATFRANLSSANGPAVDEELIFSLNNQEIGRARTGTDGTAILSHVVDLDPNTYPNAIAVSYAGGILPATPTPVTATLQAICGVASYAVIPLSLNVLPAGGPSFGVFVNTSSHCQWSAVANAMSGDQPFLAVAPTSTQTGKGTFNISIPANTGNDARASHVGVGLQLLSVQQGGVGSGCTYRFVPQIAYIQADTISAQAVMPVTATAGCHWTASADPSTPWIHFDPLDTTAWSGTGSGQIRFSVDPNSSSLKREGIVLLSDGTSTVAKGYVNQLAPPPSVCPITFVVDLVGGSVEKGQNIPLRVSTTGTQLQYQWFVNDLPSTFGCTQCPTLTMPYFDQNYPGPGQSVSIQVRVYNGCGEAFSKRVVWQNNGVANQCKVPVVEDSLLRPNQSPNDSLSPYPGAPVTIFVNAQHSDFNDPSPLIFNWYQGLPGDRSSRVATNPDDGFQDHITVNPFETSFYWVEVIDVCGAQQSRSGAVFTTIPPGRRRAVSHDFTGDGRSDIAWHNTATGQNEVWQMNGTIHTATIPLSANQDSNAQLQSTGDFNADGNTDIVWRDPQTGHNEVWLMNRTQVSEVRPLESRTDPNFTIGAVADYDNDNNDDIVWHNKVTGENEIWFQSGTTHAGTWALPANPDGNWGLYGTGDFTNDDKPDLFFHNRVTGENQIWTMDDATPTTILSKTVGSNSTTSNSSVRHLRVATLSMPAMPDNNWVPALVADMDGDGKPDIVWRNIVTGENTVWIMSGAQVTQTVPLESRPDPNWQIGGGGSSSDGGGGTTTSGAPTSLHVVVNPVVLGDPAVVTATLTSAGAAVAQRQIIFTLSGTEITRLVTDATGSGTAAIATGTRVAGTYPAAISVRFDGDPSFAASSQSADLVIAPTPASVTWGNPAAIVYGTALSAIQLNATASVPGTFVYSPAAGAVLEAGLRTLSVTFTPADSTIAPVTRTALVKVVQAAGVSISWARPDDISYGTPLSDLQLNATATLTGTFTYDPAAGTTLPVGLNQDLLVSFQPDNPNFGASTTKTKINVTKGSQLILWDDPAPITVLQVLTATQLNASVIGSGSAPTGQLTYDPPLGTLLPAGVSTLRVTVAETADYQAASVSADLIVRHVISHLQWAQPAAIVYGTPLSGTQLNATADVPGTFVYTPAAGSILDSGTQQLLVVFTPSDSRYDPVTAAVTVQVSRALQVITWSNPATITYGTPLSATQLNAQVTVIGPSPAGHLAYTVPFGAVVQAGTQTLTVIAAATGNYDSATASVTINVLKATPVVTWAPPAPIVYGAPLSATQLNATASVPGTFAYTPVAGTVLDAGTSQTLQVAFTPTDAQDYNTASQNAQLTVTKANQTINWTNPADIAHGTPLSSAQLNATVSVAGPAPAGALTYTPPAGTLLPLGSSQTLTAAVAATADYNSATATVTVNVLKATPIVTWATPASIVYGTPVSATQLNATANVPGTFTYTPAAGTVLNAGASQTLQVAFTPTDAQDYNAASQSTQLTVTNANQAIHWPNPADIVYGTPLSPAQLNASVSVVGPASAGALTYVPPAGTVLTVGLGQTLTVVAAATANYNSATASVTINVVQANPVVTWATPEPIVYGTLLSATQLNATANVPGTFAYTPPAGTVLNAGTSQTLQVVFTPTDAQSYNPASQSTLVTVTKANQSIHWTNPADITTGTLLSSVQLNATVSVVGPAPAGALTYTPPAGTQLQAGLGQTLTVTAVETENYNPATATVVVNVRGDGGDDDGHDKTKPILTWANPSGIVYGVALSAAQLNAAANVPGSFVYTPPAGTILNAGGAQTLFVAFAPTDSHNYQSATATASIDVAKASPTLSWSAPAAVVYGTPLSNAQLNATANVPGSFVYTPPAGTILNAGNAQTLSAVFTPTDASNYANGSAIVTINVTKATPALSWPAPAAIVYGTPLSSAQLNATASVPGSFGYTPPAGTILNAGNAQTLSAVFTPADASNYASGTAATAIDVAKSSSTLSWSAPAAIVYGTPLSSAQLNATANVPGSFVYTPPTGTILTAGSVHTLSVAFTPTDTVDYANSTATVTINVARTSPTLSWSAPAAIVYGTALSSAQLNATADVPGSFVYAPPSGTILNAGNAQTLSAVFTPVDTSNYASGTSTTAVDVAKANQTLSWSAPAAIAYGTRLSSSQLNAAVAVSGPAAAGGLVYSPPASTALASGTGQTLTVTAQGTTNYLPATMTVTIDVNRVPATLRIDNQSKIYGAALPSLTGTLTGIVNSDPITPQYATTATAASGGGAYPITGQFADPNGRLSNYNVTIVPATLTVSKAPLVVTAGNATKQYSDPIPQLSSTIQGFVLGETSSVLGGTLLVQATATQSSGPGTYPITATGLTSANYAITYVSGTLTVTPEDAVVAFIAPTIVSASPVTGNVTITLASLVSDLPDGSGGDIRNATLTFVNRATGATLCTAPIGLVASSNTSSGVATCTFAATAGTYTIESRVSGWYTRDAVADDVSLPVAAASQDFMTGSGHVTLATPGGSYAADANSGATFAISPQWDLIVGNVKGSVALTFNRTQNGSVHVYQISSSSLDTLSVVRATAGGVAWVTGPASLTDITSSTSPVVIDSNATIYASFVDNGASPAIDTLAITLLARNGGLLFSSKWNGVKTLDQATDGGDIQVRLKK
jgi:YD repeat-containing protein